MPLRTTSSNFNDVYRPPNTLPLINAMPPLSTNVINDDDTPSPTTSKLDSDRFTYSGGDDDASDDASSDSRCNHPKVASPVSYFYVAACPRFFPL